MFAHHRLRFLAVLAVFAVVGVACSAGTPTPTVLIEEGGSSDAQEVALPEGVDRIVDVTLGDPASGEFSIIMDDNVFGGGETVQFNVVNAGAVEHEFRLSNLDRIEEHLGEGHSDADHEPEAEAAPAEGAAGVFLSVGHDDEAEEDADMEMDVHDDGVEDEFIVLAAGDAGTLTVTFPQDDHPYSVAACLVPGHYEAGMYMSVAVAPGGAAAALDGGLEHTDPSESLKNLADRVVDVTLGGAPGEFAISMDDDTFQPGERVLFHVVNAGDLEHEFRLTNEARIEEHVGDDHSDADHAGDGGDEDMADMDMGGDTEEGSDRDEDAEGSEDADHADDEAEDAHADEAEDLFVLLQPGETGELLVTFPENPEDYTVGACLVPGHYEAGMATGVAVLGDLHIDAPADHEGEVPVEEAADDEGIDHQVNVTLGGAAGEFSITMGEASFGARSTVRFVVSNEGAVMHEFRLSNAHRIEEHIADGHDDDDHAGGAEDSHEEIGDVFIELEPGESGELTITFPADIEAYTEAACLVPGHYEAGMTTGLGISG